MSANEKWAVSFGALNTGTIEIGDSHGDIVCAIEMHRRRYYGTGGTRKMMETAGLIAAAPELLEALKNTLAALRASAALHGGKHEFPDTQREAFEAIDKAETGITKKRTEA